MKKYYLTTCLMWAFFSLYAQKSDSTAIKQWLILLKVTPQYQEEKNWDKDVEAAVSAHFKRYLKMKEEGKLILAGRTQTDLKTTFGILVFEAKTEAEAKTYLTEDPAVKAGVMTGELFPYQVAVSR